MQLLPTQVCGAYVSSYNTIRYHCWQAKKQVLYNAYTDSDGFSDSTKLTLISSQNCTGKSKWDISPNQLECAPLVTPPPPYRSPCPSQNSVCLQTNGSLASTWPLGSSCVTITRKHLQPLFCVQLWMDLNRSSIVGRSGYSVWLLTRNIHWRWSLDWQNGCHWLLRATDWLKSFLKTVTQNLHTFPKTVNSLLPY